MSRGNVKPQLPRVGKCRKAVSPAISTVIITAITIVLVLVTSMYASQVLERQRGSSEFEAVKRSILSFDDALRDVAWDKDSSRSARFSVTYGTLQLMPETWALVVNVTDYQGVSYSTYTGYVQYSLSTQYLTYGDGYQSYFLGDSKTLSTDSTETFGRAATTQAGSRVNMTLSYRVRAMRAYTATVNQSGTLVSVSYVDIWIIRLRTSTGSTLINDFNVVAKSVNVTPVTLGNVDGNGYTINSNKQCNIRVQLGNEITTSTIPLDGQKVVFNFIVAEVGVSN